MPPRTASPSRPTMQPGNAPFADFIVVCSGGDADRRPEKQPLTWIRKCLQRRRPYRQRRGRRLLSGARRPARQSSCTLHWQSQPAFAEAFPHISSGALDLCDRPHALHLGRRHRRLRHDARPHRAPSRRGYWRAMSPNGSCMTASAPRPTASGCNCGCAPAFATSWCSMRRRAWRACSKAAALFRQSRAISASPWGGSNAPFRAELNLSPADFYRQMRMQRARDLLEHSTMSVREVGLACGYASFSSFVRAFRQTYRRDAEARCAALAAHSPTKAAQRRPCALTAASWDHHIPARVSA